MLLVPAVVFVVAKGSAILLVSRELLNLSLWTVAHILEVSVQILPFLSLVVELLLLISSLGIVVHIVSLYQRVEITVQLIGSHSLLAVVLLIVAPSILHIIIVIVLPKLLRIPPANRKERASALVARLDKHFPHPAVLKITIHLLLLLLLVIRRKVGLI